MSISSPTQKPSSGSSFWEWSGWRGVMVAVGTLAIGIPLMFQFAKGEARQRVEADIANPQPCEATLLTVSIPPPPMFQTVIRHENADGSGTMKIRVLESSDEIMIDSHTGRVLEVRDHHGKKLWSPVDETETHTAEHTIPN